MIKILQKNLKKYRTEQGLSQEDLSTKCNYDKTYVGKIERGDTNPSMEAILRIADVLDIASVQLFREDVSSEPTDFEKQMENPTGEVGQLFIEVFENVPSICFLTNTEGQILQLNGAAEKFLKAESNRIVGEKINELPIWSQVGVDGENIDDLREMGSFGKQATRRVTMRYKGNEMDLQIQVSHAGDNPDEPQFVIFQLFFVEDAEDRTLLGDHFDLLRG